MDQYELDRACKNHAKEVISRISFASSDAAKSAALALSELTGSKWLVERTQNPKKWYVFSTE